MSFLLYEHLLLAETIYRSTEQHGEGGEPRYFILNRNAVTDTCTKKQVLWPSARPLITNVQEPGRSNCETVVSSIHGVCNSGSYGSRRIFYGECKTEIGKSSDKKQKLKDGLAFVRSHKTLWEYIVSIY
jgi:hypothetical protein